MASYSQFGNFFGFDGGLGAAASSTAGMVVGTTTTGTVGYVDYATLTDNAYHQLQAQSFQQAYEPVPVQERVLSFIEQLREEISGWHGSLGVI